MQIKDIVPWLLIQLEDDWDKKQKPCFAKL